MAKMIAAKPFDYGRGRLKANDPFDAEDRDARVLERAGLAVMPPEGKTKRGTYTTRMMTAGNEVPNTPKAVATAPTAAATIAPTGTPAMTTANAAALTPVKTA